MRLWRWVEIPPVALESAVKISGSGMSTVLKMAPDNKEGVIFWQGHLPMRCSIYEAEDCQNNQISHNNINYYTEEAVVCLGENSVASNNLALAEDYPHPERRSFAKHDRPFRASPFTSDKVRRFFNQTQH